MKTKIKLVNPNTYSLEDNGFSLCLKTTNKNEIKMSYNAYCRDQILQTFLIAKYKYDSIIYRTIKTKTKNIIDFFADLNDNLKLKGKKRIVVFVTEDEYHVGIMLNDFWRNPMRFSLLTLFLRESGKHEKGTPIKQTLAKMRYLRSKYVKQATEEFVDGKIYFTKEIDTGGFDGWRDTFSRKKDSIKLLTDQPN